MSPDPASEPKPSPQPPEPGDDKGPRKRYVGYMFEPRGHRRVGGALAVEGAVRWTVRRPEQQSIEQFMAAWDDRGYKMGFLVLKGQRIESISYVGLDSPMVVLQPHPDSIPDLHATLGTPAGYEWLAFASKGRRRFAMVEPNVVELQVGIRMTPVLADPQIIPVVSRHLDGRFAEAYMPGLWVLSAKG